VSFLGNVLAGLVADLLAASGGFALLILAIGRQRGRLLRFFGLTEKRVLRVYLSSLRGVAATDLLGEERVKHSAALPDSEFRGLPLLNVLFAADFYSALFTILPLLRRSTAVDVAVELAPEALAGPLDGPTVALGSPRHNSATVHILKALQSPVTLQRVAGSWCVACDDQPIAGGTGLYSAIIVKGVVNGAGAIVVAGVQGHDTLAALRYLTADWSRLERQYGKQPFALALGFAEGVIHPTRRIDVLHRSVPAIAVLPDHMEARRPPRR